MKKALLQTFFWVVLALAFGIFVFVYDGQQKALEYLSAYLMEWSLSIDNIFVFILIFSFFSINEKFFGRVLLIGILLAVLFRIIFITAGIELVSAFYLAALYFWCHTDIYRSDHVLCKKGRNRATWKKIKCTVS